MAEKYIHIWRRDHNTPQIKIRKDFMLSKDIINWAVPTLFWHCSYDDEEMTRGLT